MARALLADPDWTRKVREGREDRIVRCIYGNVCKNLDENFRKVRCVLWPKGSLQAPESRDTEPPRWAHGKGLVAAEQICRVHLFWKEAADNEAVYGYEILRAENGGAPVHLTTVKGCSYNDYDVVAGVQYTYCVRAYDIAGNRGETTDTASIALPFPASARARLSDAAAANTGRQT